MAATRRAVAALLAGGGVLAGWGLFEAQWLECRELRVPVAGPRLKGLQFTYTQNYRTKDFYGQPQRDVFGSVGISFIY